MQPPCSRASRVCDPLRHDRGGLSLAPSCVPYRQHIDLDIYSIEQRPRESTEVPLDVEWTTGTIQSSPDAASAWAGVRGENQLKLCGKPRDATRAMNDKFTLFKRLPQGL